MTSGTRNHTRCVLILVGMLAIVADGAHTQKAEVQRSAGPVAAIDRDAKAHDSKRAAGMSGDHVGHFAHDVSGRDEDNRGRRNPLEVATKFRGVEEAVPVDRNIPAAVGHTILWVD
jgi:hypothetical protein